MISHLIIYCVITALWCFIVALPSHQVIVASAFQPRIPRSVAVRAFAQGETTILTHHGASVVLLKLQFIPEMNDSVQLAMPILTPSTSLPVLLPVSSSSILLTADESVAEWRQYVPLIVSVGVILDILLGSPLANLALGPMKRASEKGAGGRGDSTTSDSNEESSDTGGGGRSLFSAFSGNNNNNNMDTGSVNSSRGKERVDSEAIAQAALNKALNTLELKRFLEENKTDEQRYEEVRRKINKQMEELDDGEA